MAIGVLAKEMNCLCNRAEIYRPLALQFSHSDDDYIARQAASIHEIATVITEEVDD